MIIFLTCVIIGAAIGFFGFRDLDEVVTGIGIGGLFGLLMSGLIWVMEDWATDVVVDKGPVVQKSGDWTQKVETDWQDAEKTLFFTPDGTEIALSDDITIVGGKDVAEYFYVCKKPSGVPLALRWNFWKDLEAVDCDRPHIIIHTTSGEK